MLVLVLGGNSDLGLALAEEFAAREKADLILASRDLAALVPKGQTLARTYGVSVCELYFDACDFSSHKAFYDSLPQKPDGVVLAFGLLPNQKTAQDDFDLVRRTFAVNLVGAASILEIAAKDFETRKSGFFIVYSSAAGERGRKSNYVYGAAKAGLTAYLSGLRHRLHASGVRLLTVIPGFARTKMTTGLKLAGPLCASPQTVAHHVWKAWKKGRDVAYVTPVWRPILWLVRNLPEALFKRTGL
ncbi:SDR family oxidoreductase [Fundidesulfovibrio butyratiphilus]